jgi:hypothetical protein
MPNRWAAMMKALARIVKAGEYKSPQSMQKSIHGIQKSIPIL